MLMVYVVMTQLRSDKKINKQPDGRHKYNPLGVKLKGEMCLYNYNGFQIWAKTSQVLKSLSPNDHVIAVVFISKVLVLYSTHLYNCKFQLSSSRWLLQILAMKYI